MGALTQLRTVTVGIDIGQRHDPTAIVVAELFDEETGRYFEKNLKPVPGGGYSYDKVPEAQVIYQVRHLSRLPLMTSYPNVAERVASIVQGLWMREDVDQVWALADATGVGRPIIDMLEEHLDDNEMLTAVTFTATDRYEGGLGAREARVGKAFLVSRLQALLQMDRIKLPKTDEAKALADELRDYEIKVNDNANLVAGAMRTGAHDDLVTALGLACLDESFVVPSITIGPEINW